LDPIRRFLQDIQQYPLLGDDPRDPNRQKVFSAASIYHEGQLEGYLYVILGGTEHESVSGMVRNSYIFRLSAAMALASLLLTLITGAFSFRWLTQRLRSLTAVMESFKQDGFRQPVEMPEWHRGAHADEIDRLGVTFEQMTRRIIEQIGQVQAADASRRDLVANVSHDLRTPLASLQGYVETLLMKEDTLSRQEKHEYLELAVKHCQRLGRLAADLFELTMLEAQESPLHSETFSLSELTHDVIQKFRLEASRKQIALQAEIPANPTFVSGEIGLIERVLENLLDNAVKYTPAKGEIRVSLVPNHEQIVTSISDTGPGIPEEELPHIFERFYRVDGKHPRAEPGTGVGLAIVDRILRLHGSSIEVKSEAGKGTTFAFGLPVHHD
jgi:signal transduction histidine kinase